MRRIRGLGILAAILVMGSARIGLATVIGDFETTALDGWDTDGTFNSPSPVLSQSTIGVTLGTSSLAAANNSAQFWGPATGNLATTDLAALATATTLSYDLTLNSAALNGGSGNFNGFAQDNEIAITLFGLGGALNIFSQENFSSAGISDSSGQNAQWNGVDGTRHIVWDLTKFTGFDPSTFNTETLAQIIANNPGGVVDAKIGFSEQTGGATGTVGTPVFYWDNVQLNPVPEPASLSILGLAACGLMARRRRTA